MKLYKVWVCVEEHDTRTDKYEDIDLNFTESAEFHGKGSINRAVAFAERLHEVGEVLAKGVDDATS